jgi:hypothetical protein
MMLALLALTSVTTGLEVHSHREVLSAELAHHGMQGETVAPAATHPGAAPHWEAGGVETTFRCPVCLLHLQSAGAAAGDSVATVSPGPDGRLTAAEPAFPHTASRLPGGSRAPPTSR